MGIAFTDRTICRINQYFDGKRSDDEILYTAEISRKQLRQILHQYEEYVSALNSMCLIFYLHTYLVPVINVLTSLMNHSQSLPLTVKTTHGNHMIYYQEKSSVWCQSNKAAAFEQSKRLCLPTIVFPSLMGTSGQYRWSKVIVSSSAAV